MFLNANNLGVVKLKKYMMPIKDNLFLPIRSVKFKPYINSKYEHFFHYTID